MCIFLLLSCVLIWLLLLLLKRPENFPPGPRGLPLLGCVPFLGFLHYYPHIGMIKLSKKYGKVTGLYLGSLPVISVVGFEAVKEVLLDSKLVGRPHTFETREGTLGKRLGLMFWDGDVWKVQRRFTLRNLRELSSRNRLLMQLMKEEAHELIQHIIAEMARNKNGTVYINGLFKVPVVNVLWAIVAGVRFQRHDAQLRRLLEVLDLIFRSGQPVGGLADSKLINRIMHKFISGGKTAQLFGELYQYFQVVIAKRKKTEQKSDFIGLYLDQINRQRFQSGFSDEQLAACLVDIFAAGSESTSNTLSFTLLYMLRYPKVQEKVQAELDRVCKNFLPCTRDRPNLIYTEAMLMEVQRISNVVPLAVPHVAVEETTVQGFRVPKGTAIIVNLYSVHMDKSYWLDPDKFRPERFLNSEGKLIQTDHFMPFGIGKRSCLGQLLARDALFIFAACLLKTFSFRSITEESQIDLAPQKGFTLRPKPFTTQVRLRS